MKKSLILIPLLLLAAYLMSACGKSQQDAIAAPAEAGTELTDALLANLEYKTLFTKTHKAQLQDGNYSEPPAPGAASQTTLQMTEFVARGQVGDVENAAALVLLARPGGSGSFFELALVIQRNGPPKNISSFLLGDRVRINSVSIEDGLVKVDMATQGPKDPMCCPNQHVINTYTLNINELVMVESVVVEASAASVPFELTGTTWQWTGAHLVDSEGETSALEILDPARYTLAFTPNETFQYQAGCVQAGGSYSNEAELIHLDLGQSPPSGCDGDIQSREFLQYLVSAISFRIENDNLILELDSSEGYLTLARGEAIETAPTITISSPAPASPVDPGQLLFVSGSASGLYGADLFVQVLDENGTLLAEEPFTLQGENADIGASGTWSVALSLENVSGTTGQIEAYAASSQDQSWLTQTNISVQFIR